MFSMYSYSYFGFVMGAECVGAATCPLQRVPCNAENTRTFKVKGLAKQAEGYGDTACVHTAA
jgi:hypothetical protein